jgi:hypothetical protein
VLAARLADVLVCDPHPLVALGLEQHLLDPAALLVLEVGALGERAAAVGDALHELVAELLELPQREDAGASARAHAPVEALARVGRAEQRAELGLEARDLVEQGAAGRALGRGDAGLERWDCGGWECPCAVDKFRHG